MRTMRLALLAGLCLVLFMVMPGRADDGAHPDPLSKITFPLDQLDEEGLMGPPDGLRALDYEFCIPGDAAHAAQVRDIDPTLRIFMHSRGRIGCGPGEYLCVGSTHQPGFRTVLLRLGQSALCQAHRPGFF